MAKYYVMLTENVKTGEKKRYVSKRQGASPGFPWRCICVLGFFEKQSRRGSEGPP